MNDKLNEIIKVLEKYDQKHLIKFYDELTNEEKEKLINQIKEIDFEKNNYFDYPKDKIFFFTQNTFYSIDKKGKIILEDKGKIKRESNGNGDIYKSFKDNNLNETLNNVEWISISGIDNILLDIIDPVFIGLACENNSDIASKSISKEDIDSIDWIYTKVDDSPNIISPRNLTDEMKYSKNEDGKYNYNQMNILSHLYKKDVFIDCENITLPYHLAFRKTSYLDDKGIKVEPTEPNSFKLEKFIYDVFPYYKKFILLEVDRDKEFSPIKKIEDVKKAEALYEKKIVDND